MVYIKKILHVLKIFLLSFLGFVVLYLIVEFCLSRIPVAGEITENPDITIYIITNGDHTDIVVPVKSAQIDWSEKIKYSNTVSKDTTYAYLAIGWGDKGFYLDTPTWSQLKFSVAFKAVFGINTTAMHTTFYHTMTDGDRCKEIRINDDQYRRLIDFITAKFQTDAAGDFINIKTDANYGDSDAFYEAKGRYSLFYTCNSWANDALKAAGQKACVWTAFDKGLFWQYR
ncbi:TIGR02117 family protein [Prevotella sp. 10(H)]|uniref:TIGR02117 family protein n=1 Tax=Prevotella sp. 10(H) TaxID=1158294 RepID=UPI000B0575A5|nr:TIGR02117 family protein [Prevotella sp. 10(H)]